MDHVVSFLLLLLSGTLRPQEVTCPRGFYAEGARQTGEVVCLSVPASDCPSAAPCVDGTNRYELRAWIYCPPQSHPALASATSFRTVTCERTR